MAQTPSGILGPVDGSVGTVTGSRWKETSYIKIRTRKRRGGSSVKQIDVQLRFSLIQNFLHTMGDLIRLTFKKYATDMTEFNAAFSYNFHNAINGLTPDYVINYQKALISRGELPNAIALKATVTGSVVFYTWQDNSGSGSAAPKDKAVLAAFCPNLNLTIFSTNDATRADGAAQLNLVDFKGETVETWIAFISEDEEEASNSFYTGELTIS